ncbi:hypothetical protein [Actinacidiphila yeochonensis]|uniref:hypothetical protein n=1 Tax=Actinacidiphila yeochonensis TaxID=89050 RepID=UPI002244F4CF|nr:hypothetical protein [Actinacidiphila yeochonensis]
MLPPTAPALGAWARLLSGTGTAGVPASVGWVRADHPATRVPRQRGTVPAPALVARFRATASPDAVQLAVYLAAAPLYLPVMQLVQRTMLPDSGPAELAEVLLSGLVVRRPGEDHRWYHFAPGVRDVLLGPLGRDEALLVLKHCSEYVEQRFGRSGPNFPALAITQLTEGPGDPLADAAVRSAVKEAARSAVRREGRAEEGVAAEFRQPFAEVAARVLERFMPLPENGAARRLAPVAHVSTVVGRARELADRFAREGMVQNLLDAVAMLRRAAGQERVRGRDPELWSELAQQLVTLWRVRGGATLLREAQEAADTAAAHHTLPARAVRARVLQAAAEDRAQVGDDRAALELLRRADREFTAVCAAPGQASEEVLGFTLERISVLERQWEISGDTGLLQETVGMLEAFADSWPPQRSRPSQLPMAHGRALLRLSGTARTRERERVYAEQAVNSFAAGLDALEREEGPPEAVVEAMLCVVDAQLRAGGRLEEAQRLVDRALGETRDRLLRATILARAGRIRAARYEESGAAGELEAAAGRFAEACRLTPATGPSTGTWWPSGARCCSADPPCRTESCSSTGPYWCCATAGWRPPSPTPGCPTGCSCSAARWCCATAPRRTASTCGRPSTCWAWRRRRPVPRSCWPGPGSSWARCTGCGRRTTAARSGWTRPRTPTAGPPARRWAPRRPPPNPSRCGGWPRAPTTGAATPTRPPAGPGPPSRRTARRSPSGSGCRAAGARRPRRPSSAWRTSAETRASPGGVYPARRPGAGPHGVGRKSRVGPRRGFPAAWRRPAPAHLATGRTLPVTAPEPAAARLPRRSPAVPGGPRRSPAVPGGVR